MQTAVAIACCDLLNWRILRASCGGCEMACCAIQQAVMPPQVMMAP
jgi:hypothetical protein